MRVTLALFSAASGNLCTPLLCAAYPSACLPQEFGLTPANSSISLSISTAMLAIGLLFTGPPIRCHWSQTSDGHGATVGLHLYVTFDNDDQLARHFDYARLDWAFVKWRGSCYMTYLSEEIHPSFVAFSMGLYISGNSIGGMSGRLISGVFTDFSTGELLWRQSVVSR